jgi:hypothetical protein
MKEKASFTLPLLILLILLLSSCTILETISPSPTAEPDPATAVAPTAAPAQPADPILGSATVESVEILTLESFPVQIHVRVTGMLPDDCSELDDIVTQQDGNTFNVAVSMVQRPAADCGDAPVPFEEIVPLDVYGLPAGSYTVSVNGIEGSFNFDIDNLPQEEPAVATVEPTTIPTAVFHTVTGRVWHDICSGSDGLDTESDPPSGCVVAADGAIIADGLLENEPGIEGVRVNLGQGSCPSTVSIITATTDADGVFTFGNLNAEEYCISVDSGDEQNQDILLPGRWTAPAGDIAEAAIIVTNQDPSLEVNFGWDFELLPADLATCSNSFELLEDINIPDDTLFAPAEQFTKRWRLRNNGTCSWSTDYTVIFVGGDQMAAEESIPLTQSVPVSQTLDVAVDMVAPDEPGTYRGNWQVAGPDGEPFGIDGNIEDAFWLRIIVEEESAPSATAVPGSGAIGGVVWDDFCINSNPGRGCLESDVNAGVFIADGSFDPFESALSDVTISLAENACPGDGTLPIADAVIDTAVTDEDGLYLFDGLSTGTYCIFMDALSEENVDLLIPGNWTWPATGVGQYSFILDPGEQALDLDFGWDYVD